MSSSLHYWTVL